MVNLDFNNIRPMNGSANDGFEEFVCQLARREEIPCTKEFVRKGKPDGGVECYKILEDGSEVAWQAKFLGLHKNDVIPASCSASRRSSK